MSLSISRRECLGVMAGSAALTVVPAKLTAASGSTDFFVVTSESVASADFLSALVLQPQLSHVSFSLDRYPEFSEFVDSISDCVLVGLVDQASSVIIESKLNDRARTMAQTQYVVTSALEADSRAVREAALDTLQTALANGRSDPSPASGTATAGALIAFYAWI